MGDFAWALQPVFGMIFAFSGVLKLWDIKQFQAALEEFRVPTRLVPLLQAVVPASEMTIGLLLVADVFPFWMAMGAMFLLIIFTLAIIVKLVNGERVSCACFGRFSQGTLTWWSVVRNIALLLWAAWVAWEGSTGMPLQGPVDGRILEPSIFEVLLGIALLLAWRNTRTERNLLNHTPSSSESIGIQAAKDRMGLPVGSMAPNFSLYTLGGAVSSLSDWLAAGMEVALVFTNSRCGKCIEVFPDVASAQSDQLQGSVIVIVASGDITEVRLNTIEFGLMNVLVEPGHGVAEKYRIPATPSAVLIDRNGSVKSETAIGSEKVREFLIALSVR